MYQFVTGPLLWLSFLIFFFGCVYRVVQYFRGLSWQLDRVAYTVHLKPGLKGAARSIFFWLVPFGVRNWRLKPGFAALFFIFHFCLIFTPIFLLAHNIILRDKLGFSLPTIPGELADFLTGLLILAALFLALRRLALPEVRILTTTRDWAVLALAALPFITGFLAAHEAAGYDFWLIFHILCGEAMLIAIPFTKLSHVVLFFCSRAQIGMDFGIKRGGMKGKGLAW